MVNPYLELNRVMTQKRISADRALANSNNINSSGGGGGPLGAAQGSATAAAAGLVGDNLWDDGSSSSAGGAKELEHNAISFGKWFFFCQHCRHGGHANCIDQWFGGTGNICIEVGKAQQAGVGDVAVISPKKRTVCGVNGCDCRCVARL